MPRNPTQTDKPSTPEDSSWDGSPLTRYAWQKELPRRLTRIDPSFRTLCEYGYTVERSKVICANPTHRDHLYINNVTKRSFTNPCDILTFIRTDPTLTPAAVPAEAAARYTIAPEVLLQTDSKLFEEIADTISNTKRRDRRAAGSGVALLRILAKELEDQSPEIGAWAAGEIASLQLAGITSPTVSAFDAYRDRYEDLNGQLDSPATDASLAAHYFAQVRRLGDMLATKLKLRVTTDGASGDLSKMISAITAVLNEEEATFATAGACTEDVIRLEEKVRREKEKGNQRTNRNARGKTATTRSARSVAAKKMEGVTCARIARAAKAQLAASHPASRVASSYPCLDYGDDDAVFIDADSIARAFDDGLPDTNGADEALDVSTQPAEHLGMAKVVHGRGRGGRGSPAPPVTPPPPDSAPSSNRSSVEKLNSDSPILDMRKAARDLGLRVDLSVGGNSRRTR
eukprot:CAMPEP_0182839244 /NCGR_PEP_ID=MMETSP0006_2-20121128/23760_1 /TAXON_ID=97485 /ORGANISM="Prymnesium parvum, Strain Texoma1" /LENGTH=457 /DNA_ID=CAMNT_0024968375 /DNA_START=627 /DNA_END=2001 /DNA_ORIENTATION=-